MNETEALLSDYFDRYPESEISDMIKLLYQNEFGCGHLVKDPQTAEKRLYDEYEQTDKSVKCEKYEDIGNGYVRANLAAFSKEELACLLKAFIASAEEGSGDTSEFLKKAEILRCLCASSVLPFENCGAYLDSYIDSGLPQPSHSRHYREVYRPAYRVILKKYAK